MPVPSNFNWVEARAKCSFPIVFKELESGASADVKTHERLYPKDSATYSVTPQGANKFSVVKVLDAITSQISDSVDFELTEEGIFAHSADNSVSLLASLTINNDGQCRLKVAGEELELWQFRKRTLETLFFGQG